MTKLRTNLFRAALSALPASIIAYLVGLWAIPAAMAERGYHAIGGEWLLVVLTWIAVYYAVWRCWDE